MFHVILYQPEIPPNTGNVIRMCANTGARLHLIAPLGFDIDEKAVRRAGMDYAELADVQVWDSLGAMSGGARHAALVRDLDARHDALRQRAVRGRRCVRVRAGDARSAAGGAGGLPAGAAPAHSDAPGQSQPESVECRRGGGLRSVATAADFRVGSRLHSSSRASLRLQRPAHQFLHRIFRRRAFVNDAVDLLADRHLHATARAATSRTARAASTPSTTCPIVFCAAVDVLA